MLIQKRAFLNGSTLNIAPVMPAAQSNKKKPVYTSFNPLGDVLPIETKTQMNSAQDYQGLFEIGDSS